MMTRQHQGNLYRDLKYYSWAVNVNDYSGKMTGQLERPAGRPPADEARRTPRKAEPRPDYFSMRNKNSLFPSSASRTHSFVQRIPPITLRL